MGLLYNIGIRLMNFVVFFLVIVLLPGLPPKLHFGFHEFHVTPSRDLVGPLELNNHLDNAERLLEGRVYGPECLIARKNEIFTSIHGGEVIKITEDHITHVAKFGQPCEAIYEEAICGRPLGLAFDTLGNNLIVADAYYGIWQVDLSNGRKKLLISPHQSFGGKIERPAKIFNSVAVSKSGEIYWTDSSSDFSIEDGLYSLFANPSGRLFQYDRMKNVSRVLLDELHFANGLALSPNEDFVVIAETGASRLMKYHLRGQKVGQAEVFVDGLPGSPDNLTPDAEGLWVPLVSARDSDYPAIYQSMAPFPMTRMFILRLFSIFEMPFRLFNNIFPNKFTQKIVHFAGHFESANSIVPKRTTILRVDWNGKILGSLHGFDKSVRFVSHVLESGDSLLLGSPFNRYIAKVKLPRGPQIKVRNVKVEGMETVNSQPLQDKPIQNSPPQKTATTTTPRPTTTTPKPTTTTPKPTTTTPRPTTTTTPRPTTTTTTTTKPPPTTTRTTTATTTTKTKKPTATTAPPKLTTTKAIPPPTPQVVSDETKPSKMPSSSTSAKPSTTGSPKQEKDQKQDSGSLKGKAEERVKPTLPPRPEEDIPKEPAPIRETIPKDTQPPEKPKLKVIKKGGVHGEL